MKKYIIFNFISMSFVFYYFEIIIFNAYLLGWQFMLLCGILVSNPRYNKST